MNENHRKRFRVSYILNTNPNELRKEVEALSEEFAIEEVRQFLIPMYGRHGFRVTRIERLEVSEIVKN